MFKDEINTVQPQFARAAKLSGEIINAAIARLVNLRYFAGLSLDDAARVLQVSRATAFRHWHYANGWLFCEPNRTE
jgi:ECF sigma factor